MIASIHVIQYRRRTFVPPERSSSGTFRVDRAQGSYQGRNPVAAGVGLTADTG
jgi:hypothetical protein